MQPKLLALVLLAMFLSACAPAISDVTCPSLPTYSKEVQIEAATELDAMPDGSVIANIFMPDYGTMRAGVRACIKARGK